MAILGIGIDLVEIERIKAANANPRFIERLLTESEKADYQELTSERRRWEFLAGRWASKEAFAKAFGTGVYAGSPIGFLDITVKTALTGQPYIETAVIDTPIHLSITHTEHYAQAMVVIESD
ncbi:MAG: holo-ACP synthase [Aerococcus sp.]|nr:holo-ACP synthase [Aerococcus sp.]